MTQLSEILQYHAVWKYSNEKDEETKKYQAVRLPLLRISRA